MTDLLLAATIDLSIGAILIAFIRYAKGYALRTGNCGRFMICPHKEHWSEP